MEHVIWGNKREGGKPVGGDALVRMRLTEAFDFGNGDEWLGWDLH